MPNGKELWGGFDEFGQPVKPAAESQVSPNRFNEESLVPILGSKSMRLETGAAKSLTGILTRFAGSPGRLSKTSPDILKNLVSGYRSVEEQQLMLKARGSYKDWMSKGEIGTPPESAFHEGSLMQYPVAAAGKSKHQFGKAVDISSKSALNPWLQKEISSGRVTDWEWYGEKDVPHFSYTGGQEDLAMAGIKDREPLF